MQSHEIANIAFSPLHLQDGQLQPTAETPPHLKLQPAFWGVTIYSPLGSEASASLDLLNWFNIVVRIQ